MIHFLMGFALPNLCIAPDHAVKPHGYPKPIGNPGDLERLHDQIGVASGTPRDIDPTLVVPSPGATSRDRLVAPKCLEMAEEHLFGIDELVEAVLAAFDCVHHNVPFVGEQIVAET